MAEQIIIVDKNDNIIGEKERGKLEPGDFYRASALWITNSRGEALLARRALTKKHSPGKWGPAAAGTNEVGETYESNIVKEADEELGIKNIRPQFVAKELSQAFRDHFTAWFKITLDLDLNGIVLKKDEVEEVRWFTITELREKFNSHPEQFIPSAKYWLPLFIK